MSEPAKVRWCGTNTIATVLDTKPQGKPAEEGCSNSSQLTTSTTLLQHHRLHCGLQALPLILELRLSQYQSLFPSPPLGLEGERR